MAKTKTTTRKKPSKENYTIAAGGTRAAMKAPDLPYRPRDPKKYRPPIALVGCGGIAASHLGAYKHAGYHVVALCDIDESRARQRQREYYPMARVYTDHRELLRREDDVEVIDAATHPAARLALVSDALESGRHVLSQKPFVLDLGAGEKLCDLADRKGVRLAVNQNGRWAPHFSYMRQAIAAGLVGGTFAAHLSVHWDHNWIVGKPFNEMRHILLYDFAIHWFDILTVFMGGREAKRVFASVAHTPSQRADPPLLAQALVEYDDAQATLSFDADVRYGPQDRTYVAGPGGTLTSVGPDLGRQTVTVTTARGAASPKLKGTWFREGFHGTMGELLCAIEEKREPANGARENLTGLALAFAAMASADAGKPKTPGKVRRCAT